MSELFAIEDIFNIMIELESLGYMHYSQMKELTNNAKLKMLFDRLSKAELEHMKLYKEFKTDIVLFKHEKVDDEYRDYMDALLKQTVRFLEESRNITDFDKGFSISVQLEKDTILFLNEIRRIVEPKYYDAIDHVIIQEQNHLKALYEFDAS